MYGSMYYMCACVRVRASVHAFCVRVVCDIFELCVGGCMRLLLLH